MRRHTLCCSSSFSRSAAASPSCFLIASLRRVTIVIHSRNRAPHLLELALQAQGFFLLLCFLRLSLLGLQRCGA